MMICRKNPGTMIRSPRKYAKGVSQGEHRDKVGDAFLKLMGFRLTVDIDGVGSVTKDSAPLKVKGTSLYSFTTFNVMAKSVEHLCSQTLSQSVIHFLQPTVEESIPTTDRNSIANE
jgi:hypothetical protein